MDTYNIEGSEINITVIYRAINNPAPVSAVTYGSGYVLKSKRRQQHIQQAEGASGGRIEYKNSHNRYFLEFFKGVRIVLLLLVFL